MAGVRWISEDHQDRHFLLDHAGQVGFLRQGCNPRKLALLQLFQLKGIGQIQWEPIIARQPVAQFLQQKADLEMAHRIRRHHELKGIEILEDVIANQTFMGTSPILLTKLRYC